MMPDKPRIYCVAAGERLDGQLEGESADAFCERARDKLHEEVQHMEDSLDWFEAAIAPSQDRRLSELLAIMHDVIDGNPEGTTTARRKANVGEW
jgi:hypothetical protein